MRPAGSVWGAVSSRLASWRLLLQAHGLWPDPPARLPLGLAACSLLSSVFALVHHEGTVVVAVCTLLVLVCGCWALEAQLRSDLEVTVRALRRQLEQEARLVAQSTWELRRQRAVLDELRMMFGPRDL